jgi:hypothetical protein
MLSVFVGLAFGLILGFFAAGIMAANRMAALREELEQ